jgi:hypothetical protein
VIDSNVSAPVPTTYPDDSCHGDPLHAVNLLGGVYYINPYWTSTYDGAVSACYDKISLLTMPKTEDEYMVMNILHGEEDKLFE